MVLLMEYDQIEEELRDHRGNTHLNNTMQSSKCKWPILWFPNWSLGKGQDFPRRMDECSENTSPQNWMDKAFHYRTLCTAAKWGQLNVHIGMGNKWWSIQNI